MIKDRTDTVFVALGGRPNDPGWERVHTSAASKIEAHSPLLDCLRKDTHHRRGIFAAVAKGFRYGTGMTVSQLTSGHPPPLILPPSAQQMPASTSLTRPSWTSFIPSRSSPGSLASQMVSPLQRSCWCTRRTN